ncbi:MAG: bifunctional adenosylcobinamide kinase/adenosylcobinamide-phosphate guanylyltransferase [Defluviitaleaceae bacterium]|nr:bifunctional adenosylcobinamide kinase/adenosylcobinamide-phosphate guanylyltransferase [Defluviitaleaceae bacterium]
MQIFISGGCKNGKSTYAERAAKFLSGSGPLYYIATMDAGDKEDEERVKRHQKSREGMGFLTIEQYRDIENILTQCNANGAFLLDSLTALLANEMFSKDGSYDSDAEKRAIKGLSKILDEIPKIVVVSDYIYNDAALYDPLTKAYRKSLATLDRFVATKCNVVLEATYTQIIVHKGRDIFREVQNAIY